jgi:hypothetical protein
VSNNVANCPRALNGEKLENPASNKTKTARRSLRRGLLILKKLQKLIAYQLAPEKAEYKDVPHKPAFRHTGCTSAYAPCRRIEATPLIFNIIGLCQDAAATNIAQVTTYLPWYLI